MGLIRLDRLRGFLVASALLVALVVIASGIVVGAFFERHHLAAQAEQTARLVNSEARRHLPETAFADPASEEATQQFARFIHELPEVFRIKVFARTGRIIWSNETKLIGRLFPENLSLQRALAGEVVLKLAQPKQPEHVYERSHAWVVEAYVPVRFSDHAGVAGVIETYQDAAGIVGDIRAAQGWIWSVAGLAGLVLWGGFAFLAMRASAAERAAIARLESQNRELSAIRRFTEAILEPRDLERLARIVVECAAAGLGLRRAALYRVGADRELAPLAHWSQSARGDGPVPKQAPMDALTTRQAVVSGHTVTFPLFTPKGGSYLFIAEFAGDISTSDLLSVRVLEIMLQAASVALSNVELFTDIRDAHQQLAAVLAGVTDRMAIIDRQMRLVWTNASGPDASALLGRPCAELMGVDNCVECPGGLAFLTARVTRGRLTQRGPGGDVRFLDVVAAPLPDGSGYIKRVLEVARDITELVEMEENLKDSATRLEIAHADLLTKNDELERANRELVALQGRLAEKERLAAVGELTVGLHHAILNPLAGVAGALSVLRHGELPREEREAVFVEIEGALKKIEDVVRRLQSLRRVSGRPYVGDTMMLDLEAPE